VKDDISVRLAQRVRELRQQAAMTQAELASRAGVTVETVARLERVLRGRSSANANPSLETLARLADALSVDVPQLLSGTLPLPPADDGLTAILKRASPATRRRVASIAEALMREEQAERRRAPRRGGKA
jgi:transcriptional regulator with XRE-family HTH domain